MTHWIWQHQDWPNFFWSDQLVSEHLAAARLSQGKLLGMIQSINKQTVLKMDEMILAEQAMDTSAIEGEHLSRDSVRSSIANRLGIKRAGMSHPPDRYVEGLIDMLLDATQNYTSELTLARLYGWHAALFPTGYSGIRKIAVGSLRQGPVDIVSGVHGKTKIHYKAPPHNNIQRELNKFLAWFNAGNKLDGLLRAGLAHVWFEMLHPFDDGNGRVGRAIIDLVLAQDEQLTTRYYSLSSAILRNRKSYYANLEQCCRGGMDMTAWLIWFLNCLKDSTQQSIALIHDISFKSRFWEKHVTTQLNDRQTKVLNRLLDAGQSGFIGGMTTRKYMHLTKTSRATAYRELNDLVKKKCLKPLVEKGRSAAYEIWHDE